MSNQQSSGRCWQVGAAGLLFAGFACYVFFGQTPSQASSDPMAPVLAAVQGKEKLQISVALERTKTQPLSGKLQIELVDNNDQVVASADKAVEQTDPMAAYRFEFPQKQQQADLNVRVTFKGKSEQIPLSKILLAKAHETSISSGEEFYAGSSAAVRCGVMGIRSLSESLPLPGSDVRLILRDKDGKKHDLAQAKTGRDGLADVRFTVPELPAGQYTLEVATTSALGEEKLERGIRIKADAKILLISDRPIYQPGQMIHLRALVLRSFDMKPVGNKDLLFEIEDGKGNKVYKRTFPTSEFGIVSVDFQLADEVNMGEYHLRAILGEHRAEKTVTVKRYVLPKFKVGLTADKSYYLPKEKIMAGLQTDYFFGKPVNQGKIQVIASTFDVQFRKFQTWEGTTDANGHAKFEIQLPDYFVGLPLKKGNALVKLDIKVTDTADHTETISRNYTVSEQPIQISLIPEGGKLVPDMENRVFAAAIYPDGSPAVCDINVWVGKETKGKPMASVSTSETGLAEFKITPKAKQFRLGNWGPMNIEMLGGKQQGWGQANLIDMRAEARDAKGNRANLAAELNSQPLGENLLLRLNKAIYQGGNSIQVDIRTSAGLPTVYLDLVRGGQIMLSRWLEVKEGRASEKIDLPSSIFGSLEVHAYQMLASGEIIRDSRVVYIQPSNDLKIEVQPDKQVYLPGESGRIRFLVTDKNGQPAQTALGVMIVDEAVYALQEMQPGLEKVYFTLQEELLKPQVEIKFKPQVGLGGLVRQPVLPVAQQQVAEVLLTAVKLPPPPRWDVQPAQARLQNMEGRISFFGQVIWNLAFNQQDKIFDRDPKAKGMIFKPGLLEDMVKQRQLAPNQLDGPLGGKITLEDLAKLEPNFNADHLARALTMQRMFQLTWRVVQYSNQRREKYFKDGVWTFPKGFLEELEGTKSLPPLFFKDAWGQSLRLVNNAKKLTNTLGHPQFDHAQIVSAGPDGKFGTKDDIQLADGGQILATGWLGQTWWLEDLGRSRVHQSRLKMATLTRNRFMRQDRFRRAGMPMFGAPGLAVPGAPMAMAGAAKNEMLREGKNGAGGALLGQAGGNNHGAAAPPKIREFFPETMLWNPALITNKQGVADLAVNFADSITTWRLTTSASSKGGALGGNQVPLKVFQEFFVDIDLPVSLTQGDEVAFPVAIYNYLKTKQTVKIDLQKEAWFELVDGGLTRSIDLKPNEVTSVKFRIRANKIGYQPLTIMAYGSKKSDAVKRVVEVVPNGQKFEKVASDRLSGKVKQTIDIPQNALPEASKLLVRIYPGVMAQVIEGVEGMIRLPGG